MSLNSVQLSGNVTRDIELKQVGSGHSVGTIGLAVNNKYKAKDGTYKEEVTFVDCEVWGSQAEAAAKYLSKGKPVIVEGRLKLDQWEKDGQKFSKLRVVVEKWHFIGPPPGDGGGGARASPAKAGAKPSLVPETYGDNDVPF